jgi:PEP-CTERM motif
MVKHGWSRRDDVRRSQDHVAVALAGLRIVAARRSRQVAQGDEARGSHHSPNDMTSTKERDNLYRLGTIGRTEIMRAVDLVAIVSGLIAAAPISAAAQTFNFTYTFNNPSPLLGYINEDGSSFDQINPAAATLNSITLHAAANATWSGGAGTDFNEATYTITLGGFHFSMTAEKQGNGGAGAFIDFTDTTPADLSDFIGSGLVPTSVFVSDTGGTAAFISSTFGTESVTYNFTLISSGVPGVPIFPASPTLTLPVPEPSTWALMLAGFAGVGFASYRASRRTAAASLRA